MNEWFLPEHFAWDSPCGFLGPCLTDICVLRPMADKSEQLEEFLRVLSALVAFPAPHPLARKSLPQAALF